MLKYVICAITAAAVMTGAASAAVPMTEIDRNVEPIEALTATMAGAASQELVYTVEHHTETDTYTNLVDGYKITVPSGMTPDASLSYLRFKLSNYGNSIEIYKESFASAKECSTYISYSNKFLEDSDHHTVFIDQEMKINGLRAKALSWTRPTLGPDDRNHYVNIDVINRTDVYTITIKSNAVIDYWYDVAMSFTLTPPTAAAAAQPFAAAETAAKNEETAAAMERIFGEESGLDWGLYLPNFPSDGIGAFDLMEEKLGGEMSLSLTYFFLLDNYDQSLVRPALDLAWQDGKVTELTMQLSPAAPQGTVYDILLGKYDAFLNGLIADVKDFGHPVLMRPFNEMNGEWCNYSSFHTSRDPDVYIRLYRYIVDKFRAAAADNVIWVWNPNERPFPNFLWNCEELYYPGSAYVDVVGLTGYNTGTYYSDSEKWRGFDEIYANLYTKACLLYNKPLMITEFSCSSIGGDKLAWVRDMFNALPHYPLIKAAIWWNSCDYDASTGNVARSYFVNDTEGVVEVFQENLGK